MKLPAAIISAFVTSLVQYKSILRLRLEPEETQVFVHWEQA